MPDVPDWAIPLLICGARILDVSIGTVRTLMLLSGSRYLAAGLGFIEVLIWVLAVGSAVQNLTDPWAVLGYASGFSIGTLVGMMIDSRLALGHRVLRIINPTPEVSISEGLRSAGYNTTRIEGHGPEGPVEITFLSLRRRAVPEALQALTTLNPKAFYSLERAERVSESPMLASPSKPAGFMRHRK